MGLLTDGVPLGTLSVRDCAGKRSSRRQIRICPRAGCAGVAILALLGGCSGDPTVGSSTVREAVTGIDSDEAIVIALHSLKQCRNKLDADCTASAPSVFDASDLEYCVANGVRRRIKNVQVIHASQMRTALALKAGVSDSLRSVEATVAALEDPASSARLRALRVRYVVMVDIQTYDSRTESKWDTATDKGGAAIAVTRSWWHNANLTATIVDAREVRKAGVITVNATGKAGYAMGVALIYILPVPLVFPTSFSGSESLACLRLGDDVAAFLTAKDNPPSPGSAKADVPLQSAPPAATLPMAPVLVVNETVAAPNTPSITSVARGAEGSTLQRVGDRWRYSLTDRGIAKGTVTIEIVETSAQKVREHVTREGYPAFSADREVQPGFDPTKFQPLVTLPGGYELLEISPYFPPGTELTVGKSLGQITGTFAIPGVGKTSLLSQAHVASKEKVRVPAGEFTAWRVETVPETTLGPERAVVKCTFWYSPDISRTVKMHVEMKWLTTADFKREADQDTYELLAFDPAK